MTRLVMEEPVPRYICPCGGAIEARVPPANCPHCGAKIARVRKPFGLAPLAIIALFFAGLLAFALWLARQG